MFNSRIFWRLYAGFAATVIISMLIVGFLVSRQVGDNGFQEINHSLAVRSELLAEVVRPFLKQSNHTTTLEKLQNTIAQLGNNTQSRLTVIAPDGTVIADSQESPDKMDNHQRRPEIINAKEKGFGNTTRFSTTLEKQMVYRALQVKDNLQVLGFVRVSLPLDIIDEKLSQLRSIVLFGASIAAFSALLLGFYFSKRFSDPLTKMTNVAEAISKGDYSRRISVDNKDEIGVLAEAFNEMARSSAQRMTKITADHNRLTKIFEGMVEGVVAVDRDQCITDINQAGASILDLDMSNCLFKPLWEQARINEIGNSLEQAMASNQIIKTQMIRSSNTGDLVVDIHAVALRDENNEPIGAVIVLHDISEIARLEHIRRDFVANASHELKTPITAIRGLTETILDDSDMDTETRHRFMEKIHTQSIRLSDLVSDLMTISRLESGQTESSFQPFDLIATVHRSVATISSVSNDKHLSVNTTVNDDIDARLMLMGNQQEISQLIDNLLDNAVKYTPSGGSIDITIARQDKNVQLTVSDSGIGISPQDQLHIFERFYRVDKARSRQLGGTGLGLSIVKNIAEQHGGSVLLVSNPDSGSSFIIDLPLP